MPNTLVQLQSPTEMLAPDADEEKRLRRQRDLAVIGALMNTKPTLAVSEILAKDVTDQREEARRRGERAQANRRRYLGGGFFLEPDGSVVRDPDMEQAEAEREERLRGRIGYQDELIRGRAWDRPSTTIQTGPGGEVVPVTTTPRGDTRVQPAVPGVTASPPSAEGMQKSAEAVRLANKAGQLGTRVADIPGAVDPVKSATSDLLGRVPVFGEIARNVYGERAYTAAERALRGDAAMFENDLSNLAAGLSLTGFEIGERNKWSPFVPGISKETAQARLAAIEAKFRDRARTFRGQPPGASNANSSTPAATEEWVRGPDGRLRRK